jgi:hypothetical protein
MTARMQAFSLGLAIMVAGMAPASAADAHGPRYGYRAPAPERVPLALRTLSKRSAAVLASDACWRGCTAECGWYFQGCIKLYLLDGCMAHNNYCELTCLRQCRLLGGPLVSSTVWWPGITGGSR